MDTKNTLAELHSDFFQKSNTFFLILDRDLHVIDMSSHFMESYQLEKKYLIGKHVKNINLNINNSNDLEIYIQENNSRIHDGFKVIIEHPFRGNEHWNLLVFKMDKGYGIIGSNISVFEHQIDLRNKHTQRVLHDINSPIRSLLGLTNLADNSGKDSNALVKYFELAKQCTHNLSGIIEKITDSWTLGNNISNTESVDFITILDEVKGNLKFIDGFSEAIFDESIDDVSEFYFNRDVVESLFQNIIDNSIKFRKTGVELFIQIEIIRWENNSVKITFRDNGIGIAESHHQNIFTPFYRVNNYVYGKGVGLYLLRNSIDSLGGSISFESMENKGTTFIVILPNTLPNKL